jgi:hypothetical protein
MADNFAITPGSGVTIAADDISSVWHQRVKVSIGADGAAADWSDTTPAPTSNMPRTTGGLTTASYVSAASTNATSVKASAGQVYGIAVYSTNAAARYLKLYNKASAPTVGTDTPVLRLTIPGGTAGAGLNFEISNGAAFATGIAFALTTGAADTDTTGVALNEILVNILYK